MIRGTVTITEAAADALPATCPDTLDQITGDGLPRAGRSCYMAPLNDRSCELVTHVKPKSTARYVEI